MCDKKWNFTTLHTLHVAVEIQPYGSKNLDGLQYYSYFYRDFFRVCRGPKFGPIPNAKKEMFFPK
jgi:hypothetical protein